MLLTRIVFLKCIKILLKILSLDLRGWADEALVLLPTSPLIWQAYWIYMLLLKQHALCASAIALMFRCWCLRMFPAFYPAPTRNGMPLSATVQNFYMLSVKPRFRALP